MRTRPIELDSRAHGLRCRMLRLDGHDNPQVRDLRITYDFIDAVDGRVGDVLGLQAPYPVIEGLTGETRVELEPEGFVFGDAALARIESRVACEFRCFKCGNQSFPKLLERRQMNGDETLIGGTQDVRLSQARSVRRRRRLAQSEKGGEGF